MRDRFISRLLEEARKDKNIMLLTGDLGFGVLDAFSKELPEQFMNIGVAEQNMIGIAAGLALEGHKVFTYSIGNFGILRCLEQIRNDLVYHDAHVTVITVGSGFSYGSLGMSHHATEDVSILRSFPLTLCSPGDLWEASELASALVHTPGTKYLRLDKSSAGNTQKEGELFQLGKARTLREGTDVTLLTSSGILAEVLKAADTLQETGITCRVLHFHTLKPIDKEAIIKAAQETQNLLTIEEHVLDGGLGGIVAEILMDSQAYPKLFKRLGVRGGFTSIVGSQKYLQEQYGIDAQSIVKTVVASLATA